MTFRSFVNALFEFKFNLFISLNYQKVIFLLSLLRIKRLSTSTHTLVYMYVSACGKVVSAIAFRDPVCEKGDFREAIPGCDTFAKCLKTIVGLTETGSQDIDDKLHAVANRRDRRF